ncbi:URA2, partial [Symbiodinium necroappetens]
ESKGAPFPPTQPLQNETEAGKRAARDKQKESGIKARKKTRKKHKKANKQKDEKKDRKRQRCAPLMLTPQATNEDFGDAQGSISDDIFEKLMDVSVSSGDDEHFPEE